MTQQQIRNLYYRHLKGNKRATEKLNKYIRKNAPTLNKRLATIEKRGLKTRITDELIYFRQNVLGTSYIPSTLKAIEAKTDLVLPALLQINKAYTSNIKASNIEKFRNKVVQSLRENHGLDIPADKRDIFWDLLFNDFTQTYMDFDSEAALSTLNQALQVDGALEKLEEVYNKWKNNENYPTYNAWQEFDRWVENEKAKSSATD